MKFFFFSFGAEILNGLLPNCVFRKGIVLQYWILYCRDLGLKGKIVLQGQVLYRDIGSLASREVSCDTACWARRNGVGTRRARSRSAGMALGSRLGSAWTGAERADRLARTGAQAQWKSRRRCAGQASGRRAGERQERGRAAGRGLGVAGRWARGLARTVHSVHST